RGVFDEVTKARAGAIAAGSQGPQERAQAENVLTGALRSLFAVAEAYPQLQAVQEFKDLSENLRDTEDKIQFSRRFYNGQVRDYNTALQTFPTVALAGMFGFKASEYFEVEEPADREVPKVSSTPTTSTMMSQPSATGTGPPAAAHANLYDETAVNLLRLSPMVGSMIAIVSLMAYSPVEVWF